MKVVLFCGGQGMRLREHSQTMPKPMVRIGYRPILWHIMKYYAHFGHTDFILCLGWQADVIKRFFLNYDECTSNDFVLNAGGERVTLLGSDIQDWNITFVDTGITSSIGQRLKAVQKHLDGEEMFLANYADGLTNFNLPHLIEFAKKRNDVGSFLAVRPSQSFHQVNVEDDGTVSSLESIRETDVWMNGGYFVLRNEIFDVLKANEDLVDKPFQRLIDSGKLGAIKHDGFWACMDTYKEMKLFDEMYSSDDMPWQLWRAGLVPSPISPSRPDTRFEIHSSTNGGQN